MDRNERLATLEEAQEKLQEAIELIEQAVRGQRNERGVDAYLLATLKMCASNDHGYLGRQDYNLGDLIESELHPDEEEE